MWLSRAASRYYCGGLDQVVESLWEGGGWGCGALELFVTCLMIDSLLVLSWRGGLQALHLRAPQLDALPYQPFQLQLPLVCSYIYAFRPYLVRWKPVLLVFVVLTLSCVVQNGLEKMCAMQTGISRKFMLFQCILVLGLTLLLQSGGERWIGNVS